MIMAMTVVLPAPVASFQRQAHQLGIGILVRRREVIEDALAAAWIWGATSVSQIAVSTAST
jgi:hypothetical protein